MEGNGLSGGRGLFIGMGSGMLGLEKPLHSQQQQQQQQQQNPQNPHHLHHHLQNPQMVAFAISHHESDHNPQNQQSVKHNYPYPTKPKQLQHQLVLSDEDEAVGDDGDGKMKVSPWQRMKWTDSMVRLLIMAVFYIGDDQACSEGTADAASKKKGGGMLQKKGKWKSVSRAMMEKGFYVSPQQCEDKFNDLNKRYKRVNDILGKGTACRVVENQSLLNSMDHLSPKLKEEVRKLLNSKHLFFREMCAYHNSCGGGSGGGAAGNHQSPPEMAAGPSHHQHQRCHHSPDNAAITPNLGKTETEGSKMVKGGSGEEEEDEDDDEDDDYEDEDDDDDDEEVVEGGLRPYNDHTHHNNNDKDNDDDEEERSSRKKQRKAIPLMQSPLIQQLSSEVMTLLGDGSKNPWEKKQWVKTQLMKLEEQRVSYQCEAFELEKQRLKWVKFSSKKEREMERAKLKNERTKLENERMLLLLRQKEIELIQYHHHQQCLNKSGDPSSISITG